MRRGHESHSLNAGREDHLNLIEHRIQVSAIAMPWATQLADLMILAIDTAEVAPLKENIADPFRSAD